MAKKRNNLQGYTPRKVNTRQVKQRFLIVCQGEATETNYFKSFRVPKKLVKVEGVPKHPSKLVEKAKELSAREEYDQVWCVFDRDEWTPEDFNTACKKAKEQGFEVAYSNEAFELWYVLHFVFLNTGISRKDYCKKLTTLLGHEYEKNSETIYDQLFANQPTALKNAKKPLERYNPKNPANDNPSKTVYKLVEELNK